MPQGRTVHRGTGGARAPRLSGGTGYGGTAIGCLLIVLMLLHFIFIPIIKNWSVKADFC